MHQKHHHLIIATYALLVLAAPLIWVNGVHAQQAVCPTGYTCTPIQQVANCPAGFYCTPTTGGANSNGQFSNGYYWDKNTYTTSGSAYTMPGTSAQTAGQTSAQNAASSCYVFGANLGVGSTGADVTALQKLLLNKGYSISASGTFDYQTANAVGQYQSALGIPATGFVGPLTRAHLNTDCGSTSTTSPSLNPNLSLSASYQGTNASGSVYIFSASIVNSNVAYIRITLSCPANVSAVMKVSGDCNDDGALMGGQNVSWNGLLLNHTSSYQTVVITAKAISASGSVIATAQTQVSIAPSSDWQGSSNSNPAPVSVSYPTAGMTFTSGTPISIAFLNPVLGTTYRIQLRGKGYSTDLGTTYVGFATDQQKAIFLLPSNIPADAAPFSIVIMIGNTDVAYSPSISIVSSGTTAGVSPSAAALSASCSGAPSGKDSYDLGWTAQAIGGSAPYSYSWSVYNDVSSYITGSTQSASFSAVYATPGVKQAIVRISDGTGATVSATCSAATIAAKSANTQPAATLGVSCLGTPIAMPASVSWTSTVSGGVAPYTFSWNTYNDVSVYTTGSTQSGAFAADYSTSGTKSASLRITDSGGNTASATCSASIPVTGSNAVAPVVTVMSPANSPSWTYNSSQTISWTDSGTPGATYTVYLVNASGGVPDSNYGVIQSGVTGNSILWSVGRLANGTMTNLPNGTYYIQVDRNGSVYAASSNAPFALAGSPASAAASAPVTPPASSGPSTTLLISLKTIKLGDLVTLLSNTTSPSGSLKSAAIDLSTDNATWTSGAPCGYWNSPTGTDTAHAITCNFTPDAAGTYYFRSRGTDSVGASNFVYQTLIVQ